MKFKDPSTVTCPACGNISAQVVKDLLADRAACPSSGHVLTETGHRMRQRLDEWSEYVAAIVLSSEVDDQNREVRYDGDILLTIHNLQDLIVATETLLTNVPARLRRETAEKIVLAAFRSRYPLMEYPPLGERFADSSATQAYFEVLRVSKP